MIARAQRVEQVAVAPHPLPNAKPYSPAFERCEAPFERVARGVAAARIFVAFVSTGAVLREGAGEHDGGHHCAARRIGLLSGVDGQGIEPELLVSRIGLL